MKPSRIEPFWAPRGRIGSHSAIPLVNCISTSPIQVTRPLEDSPAFSSAAHPAVDEELPSCLPWLYQQNGSQWDTVCQL